MEDGTPPASAGTGTRGARIRGFAAAAAALIALAMSAAGASAHTWNLATDFAVSPNGTTAPPNPFPDSYAESGVWAAGYASGGTYSTAGSETVYSGVTSFTVAPAADWHESAGGAPGAELWQAPAGYPYTGVNSTTSQVSYWPAESVFMHPLPDSYPEPQRAAVRWVSPITGTVSVDAGFADEDCNGGDGIDYSVDTQPAGSSTLTHLAGKAVGYCGSGSYSAGSLSVTKGDAYYFSVGDGGNNEFSYDTTAVSVKISDGATETLSINPPASVATTYKQPITPATVTGKDSDGDAVSLSATNVPAGLSFNAGTGMLSGTPTVNAGRYVITFAANDGHGDTVTKRTVLTIGQGRCKLTNKSAQLVTEKTQAASAKLTDAATKAAIAGAEVLFGSEGAFGATAMTAATGIAKLKTALAAGVYPVNAEFGGNTDYEPCAVPSRELMTVSPASWTATGATAVAVGKATAQVGFNVTAIAESGQPDVVIAPTGTFVGEAITSLSKPTPTSATWTGTGSWQGEPAEYTITAVDPASGSDTVSITVTVGGSTVFSTSGAKAAKGGDVKVH